MTRKRVQFSPHVLQQLAILSICRFAEPVAMTSVTPYLYYMVEHFGVPTTEIAKYVGITFASFSFCQFFTGIWWGRASDKFGRKPMIMFGLVGTLVSFMAFGFATSLQMAIAARCFSGLVNGNVGIVRTMVAEMVPEKELQPRAFSLMPLIWTTGAVLGPMIGGSLADPIRNHRGWFKGEPPVFFKKFPFALPNLVASAFFVIGLATGILFLDETLETQKDRPDVGRRLGDRLVKFLRSKASRYENTTDERTSLLQSESSSSLDEEFATAQRKKDAKALDVPPMREAFTTQSSLNLLVYCVLALHSITFDQMLPVLMAYPRQDPSQHQLPFKFAGGFGMNASQVGNFFAVFGVSGMVLQLFVFPHITTRLGPLFCLRVGYFTMPIVYLLLPFVITLSRDMQQPALYALMFIKTAAVIFAFPCSTILLTNSSPTLRLLGTLNGFAVTLSAMGRAIGPAVGGLTFSAGQRIGYIILPWWVLTAVALLGGLPSAFLVEGEGFARDSPEDIEEEEEEEEVDQRQGSPVK